MSRIYLQTIAYNAEKTIHRCVGSILNQTYNGRIEWNILDNGSTDQTLPILRKYEQKYEFIHVFHIGKNQVPQSSEEHKLWNQFCKRIQLDLADDDLYCTLDSDDAYTPDFFKKMTDFMTKYDLDIAAAGTIFVNAESNTILAKRNLNQTLILNNPNAFSTYFDQYHAFMRPVWGKLFKGFTLKNYVRNEKLSYGSDTWFVFHTLRQASRVGIMDEPLYKYYISTNSISNVYNEKRIKSDRILNDDAHDFLISKCGAVNEKNEDFLFGVYLFALIDTLKVMLAAPISFADKITGLYDIFTYENTRQLLSRQYYCELKELLNLAADWIISQEHMIPEHIEIIAQIILAMYPKLAQAFKQEILVNLLLYYPELIKYLLKEEYGRMLSWLSFWFRVHEPDDLLLTDLEVFIYHTAGKPDHEIFKLYMEIKDKRPVSYGKLAIDSRIRELTSKYPLLQNISVGLSMSFPHTVCSIMTEDYGKAFAEFISAPQSIEISDEDAESYFLLGQNLSAINGDTEVYIYYIKMRISYLIDCSKTEEARNMLDEFGLIIPDDEDLIELRKKLS